MSSRKRKSRGETEQKAARLAEAKQQLVDLQGKLTSREEHEGKLSKLQSTVIELLYQVPKAGSEEGARIDKYMSIAQESILEQQRQADNLPPEAELRSDIEDKEALIQGLSTPTYEDRVVSRGPPLSVERAGLYKVQTQSHDDSWFYDCCFPADAQPPIPLSLVYPVFVEFLDDFNDAATPLDNRVCDFVTELCYKVLGRMGSFGDESELQGEFNVLAQSFLGHHVSSRTITCRRTERTVKASTDATVEAGNGKWTALGELKLEKGCTLAHGLQTYALYVCSLDGEAAHLPCFFMEIIGPTIRIGGFANFQKVAWQPFTPFLNCFFTKHDRTDMATLCRAMRALRKGLNTLDSYYGEAHPSISPKDIPYRLQDRIFRKSVRIGDKLVFKVTLENGEDRIFKYCRQYGEQVHRSWAEGHLAPNLYGCTQIPGGWLEVEMQFLDGWSPVDSFLLQGLGREAERADLRAAISGALDRALAIKIGGCPAAHGDVRSPNIMIKREEGGSFAIRFIDFDWAGKAGEALYPPFMNMKLPWHPEVGAGRPLEQIHDRWWMERNRCVPTTGAGH